MMTGNEKTALRPMALYTAVYLLWFRLVEALPRSSYQVIELALDRKIPFVEEFVLPYVSWFAFVPLGVLLLLKYDREMYDRAVTFLMTGMTVFLLVSTLFPNMQFLRPFILPRENVFTKLIGLLWMVDTPTNVSPSIHVFNTLAILVMIWKSRAKELKGLRLRLMWTVWGALIILSTMFIKQHSLLDVLAAFLLAGILYVFVFRYGMVFRFDGWNSAVERRAAARRRRRWRTDHI